MARTNSKGKRGAGELARIDMLLGSERVVGEISIVIRLANNLRSVRLAAGATERFSCKWLELGTNSLIQILVVEIRFGELSSLRAPIARASTDRSDGFFVALPVEAHVGEVSRLRALLAEIPARSSE
jgi:hypothetical protein